MTATIVFLHAHPDDESLLTGGSIARWHDAGHRVVVVTATDGGRGLSSSEHASGGLHRTRRRELERACAILGVDRLEILGYEDSGSDDAVPPGAFSTLPVGQVGTAFATIVERESADVVVGYDRNGGYGHPDHRQVHRVARRTAALLDGPALIEATVNRDRLQRALRVINWLPSLPDGFEPSRFDTAFSSAAEIDFELDVRAFVTRKLDAFAAHQSQSTGDGGNRTLGWCRRLPAPVFTRVFGREWFRRASPDDGRSEQLAELFGMREHVRGR